MQVWLTDRGMSTCAKCKSTPPVRTLAWLGCNQQKGVISPQHIRMEEHRLTAWSRCPVGTRHSTAQPRQCQSQYPAPMGLSAICRHNSQLPRRNPWHHLCLSHPARSQVLPLTSSASKHNNMKPLLLTAALWQILWCNRHTCNLVIPATTHYTLLYDYQDFNKYLYICWYCICYSVTTLQYPIYVILCIFVTCFIFNCLGTNAGSVKCKCM